MSRIARRTRARRPMSQLSNIIESSTSAPGVHAHAAAQHRIAHHASGKNRAAGDDRIDRLAAAALLVENKFRGRRPNSRRCAAATGDCIDSAPESPRADPCWRRSTRRWSPRRASTAPAPADRRECGWSENRKRTSPRGPPATAECRGRNRASCRCVLRVRVQLPQQQIGRKNVVAHGRVDALGIARHGGRVGALFVEADHAAVRRRSRSRRIRWPVPLGTGIAAMVACARLCMWNSIISRMFMR